jgi:hypothetical protein
MSEPERLWGRTRLEHAPPLSQVDVRVSRSRDPSKRRHLACFRDQLEPSLIFKKFEEGIVYQNIAVVRMSVD